MKNLYVEEKDFNCVNKAILNEAVQSINCSLSEEKILNGNIYDVNNTLNEEELYSELQKKTAKQILYYIDYYNITDEIEREDVINQMFELITDTYYKILNLCKNNQIIVNFINTPFALQYSGNGENLITKPHVVATKKIHTPEKYIETLLNENIKKVFIYCITVINGTNKEQKYPLFIRSYESSQICSFNIEYDTGIKG